MKVNNLVLVFLSIFLVSATCAKQELNNDPQTSNTPIITVEEASPEPNPNLINWAGEYNADSIDIAFKEDKLVLLYFYSDESEICAQQNEVFSDPEVALLINRMFISFKMDIKNISPDGKRELGIIEVPLIYFLLPQNPKEDSKVKQFVGIQDKSSMLQNILIAWEFKQMEDAEK